MQVGGRFYGNGGGTGGYKVGADTALDTGGHDRPSAWIQRGGGLRTLDGLSINCGTLLASPPL